MSEETSNTPDFANRPKLSRNPQRLTPEIAEKDSALNQDLRRCAQWLKDNKDKAGSSEYERYYNSLEMMAEKGYPMAEFEFAKFLMSEGELNRAALYFDRAKNNENAGPDLRKEIQSCTSSNSNNEEENQKRNTQKDDKHHQAQRSPLQEAFAKRADDGNKSGFVKAREQAQLIKARQEQNEGYLPHHSYVPPKQED